MIDYEKAAAELGRLVTKKQQAYGDSFGKSEQIFKILYPDGVKPEQYTDFLTLVRIVDKMFRIATAKDAFGENPFMDIEGYALLARTKEQKAKDGNLIGKIQKALEEEPKPLLGHQRDDGSDSRIPKETNSEREFRLKMERMADALMPRHQYDRDMEKADLEVELASRPSRRCLCAGVGCSDCA